MNDMAFVSDNRPHTLGDLIVITGTVANGDQDAELGAFLTEILMVTAVSNAAAAGGAPLAASIDTTSATKVRFADPGASGGRLMVFGKR